MNVIPFTLFILGFFFCAYPVYRTYHIKRYFSLQDRIFFSIVGLVFIWLLVDFLSVINSNLIFANVLKACSLFTITLLVLFCYFFSICIKRELITMDVLLVFPAIIASFYFIFQTPWTVSIVNDVIVYHYNFSQFTYWVLIMLLFMFFSLKGLYVLLSWFKAGTARFKVLVFIYLFTFGSALTVLFNIILYPYIIQLSLGSFLNSMLIFLLFRFFLKTSKQKGRTRIIKIKSPVQIALSNISNLL